MYLSLHKKILSSTTVINIDKTNLKDQIDILEWFLKEHVTLKIEEWQNKCINAYMTYIASESYTL